VSRSRKLGITDAILPKRAPKAVGLFPAQDCATVRIARAAW
jgi:hypothetical protein